MSTGGKIWWMVYPLILYIGIQLALMILGSVVMLIIEMVQADSISDFKHNSDTDPLFMTISNYVILIASAILTLIIGKKLRKRDCNTHGLVRDKSQSKSPLSWIAIIFAAVGFCLFSKILISITDIMDYFPVSQSLNDLMGTEDTLYGLIASVTITPITTEIFFRGLIFKRMRSFMGFLPAALISGALFGILYLNIVLGIFTILGGVIFAYIYEKKQSLSGTIAAHIAANISSFFVEQLPRRLETDTNMLIIMLGSGVICVIGILLLKKAFKDSPEWQVQTITE
jgi:membrane protease YdiL (CAAX protease family)